MQLTEALLLMQVLAEKLFGAIDHFSAVSFRVWRFLARLCWQLIWPAALAASLALMIYVFDYNWGQRSDFSLHVALAALVVACGRGSRGSR